VRYGAYYQYHLIGLGLELGATTEVVREHPPVAGFALNGVRGR